MTEAQASGAAIPVQSYNITGVRIDDLTREDVLRAVEAFVADGRLHRLVTPNVALILHAHRDEIYRTVLNSAALSIPDGMWLNYGARLLGIRLRENVAGRLLVRPLCELCAKKGWRVYILASAPGIAPMAAARLMRDYPGLQIVAARSPSFQFVQSPDEINEVLEEMRRLAPDLLFVGLGSPKGERWIYDYRDRLPVKVAIGVGYAFDVIAGKVAEAPRWMTHTGFEWLFRLLQEPRRLWRRYLLDGPRFFYLLLEQKFKRIPANWPVQRNP
ncbi:MAG: WecB/TagA/CpsF family glycosyltransferase [bacterium]